MTGSKALAVSNFLTGVFIDTDHFLDYYLSKGFSTKFKIVDFYNVCMNYEFTKLYVFLHSFELLLILWIIAIAYPANLIWWGIVIGASQHLIFDVAINLIKPLGYSFAFRLIKKFNMKELMKHEP